MTPDRTEGTTRSTDAGRGQPMPDEGSRGAADRAVPTTVAREGRSREGEPDFSSRLAALRRDVTSLVHASRADGTPVQRLLPRLERLVRNSEVGEGRYAVGTAVLGLVVEWAIEAYYDEPELACVPRFY